MSRAEFGNTAPMEQRDLQLMQEPSFAVPSDALSQKESLRQMHNGILEQIKREEETRSVAPEAYRLSLMSDSDVTGAYRRGKDHMSSADLLRYARETRAKHLREVELDGNTGIDECTGSNVKETAIVPKQKQETSTLLPAVVDRIKQMPTRIKEGIPLWFDSKTPDTSADSRRFPLSAFAAILAIAMSLMLIVASSVLLTRAEDNVSRMKLQVSETSDEVAQMRSDIEASIDLLEIRRIAMEEYGMVEEEYLKMDYISMKTEDSVEAFEDERPTGVGLSAILSAIGIKK